MGVEAILQRKKKKISSAATHLSLKSPYLVMIAAIFTLQGTWFQLFKNLTDAKAVPENI